MTEVEKLQRAKMYVDKLANGINPLDDSPVPKQDIINHIRLSRCLFYVSDVLRQVIENGGVSPKAKASPKSPFYLTDEQKRKYVPSAIPLSVSEITQSLNAAADLEKCKKLKYSQITDWLVEIGALRIQQDLNGKTKKYPTSHGLDLGITSETRNGANGEYRVTVYNEAAQRFIVDNLDAVLAVDQKAKEKVRAENQGQAWTQTQDERLVELFNQNVPVPEIAAALLRSESGIRARLKRLGIIEKRSDA